MPMSSYCQQAEKLNKLPFHRHSKSQIRNEKVGLSLNMIYNLAKGLHLPLEVLVQPVEKMKVG